MNSGTEKAIQEGDLNAVRNFLASTWDADGLTRLYHKAHKEGRLTLAQMISARIDQIRGS